jgi:hypothetical protein
MWYRPSMVGQARAELVFRNASLDGGDDVCWVPDEELSGFSLSAHHNGRLYRAVRREVVSRGGEASHLRVVYERVRIRNG